MIINYSTKSGLMVLYPARLASTDVSLLAEVRYSIPHHRSAPCTGDFVVSMYTDMAIEIGKHLVPDPVLD